MASVPRGGTIGSVVNSGFDGVPEASATYRRRREDRRIIDWARKKLFGGEVQKDLGYQEMDSTFGGVAANQGDTCELYFDIA